jgi:serine/threonine protein kinase
MGLKLNDLDLLTVLGKGAFGKVFLGKLSSTNKFYAVKMLQKNMLIKTD